MHDREFDVPSGTKSGGHDDESATLAGPSPASFVADESSNSLAQSGFVDPALALIVEEITRRTQRGEQVDLHEYARSHPEWASMLHSLLSPLRLLAQFRRAAIEVPSLAPSTDSVLLPVTLGDFKVRREIGRGGMGIVYEAEQVSLGRRVALKILSAAASLDAQSSRRFQVEAQAAACLSHAHIVPVHAFGSHDDVPFYAMQFIEGASLAEIVTALRRSRDGEPIPTDDGPRNLAYALAFDLLADHFGHGLDVPKPEPRQDVRQKDYVRAVGAWPRRPPRPSTMPTNRGSSTATSSRPTCSSTAPASSGSPTSDSPGSSAATP